MYSSRKGVEPRIFEKRKHKQDTLGNTSHRDPNRAIISEEWVYQENQDEKLFLEVFDITGATSRIQYPYG